ncbi:hypothetical protein MP228_005441 [Amoeboaphelidium protococcarum]|nr:hypothetical protein MP228_005441 [Amoeboaphelidium protococcarum]
MIPQVSLVILIGVIAILCRSDQHVFQSKNDETKDIREQDRAAVIVGTANLQTQAFVGIPPANTNWAILDLSSAIRLGYGKILASKPTVTGATFRHADNMGGLDGSCMYWKNKRLNFVDPGYNPYLIGVGAALWHGSKSCGQCYLIQNPTTNRSVTVMITDYCPECSRHQLDMNAAASAFLSGGPSYLDIPYHPRGGPRNYNSLLTWPVECDWKGQRVGYFFDNGSSRFNWYIILYFLKVPLKDVRVESVMGNGTTISVGITSHDKYGRWVVQWRRGEGGAGLYKITMTSDTRVTPFIDYVRWNGIHMQKVSGTLPFKLSGIAKNIPQWPL